jgi:hypothetical protein
MTHGALGLTLILFVAVCEAKRRIRKGGRKKKKENLSRGYGPSTRDNAKRSTRAGKREREREKVCCH